MKAVGIEFSIVLLPNGINDVCNLQSYDFFSIYRNGIKSLT